VIAMTAKPKAAKAATPKAAKAAIGDARQFDLVGEDGRRIMRWASAEACRELAAKLVGEKTEIGPAIPKVEAIIARAAEAEAVNGIEQGPVEETAESEDETSG